MALSRRAEGPAEDPRGGVVSRSGLVRLTSNPRGSGSESVHRVEQFSALFVATDLR
jgi:hypothetical protein